MAGLAVIGLLLVVLVTVPLSGGPAPGRLLAKTTDAQCADLEESYEGAPRTSAKAGWVWAANGYGWGCRYEYADGTTGEIVFPQRRSAPNPAKP